MCVNEGRNQRKHGILMKGEDESVMRVSIKCYIRKVLLMIMVMMMMTAL